MRFVLLLRGINVGGKNKLPMKTLAALVEAEGGTDVVTYIQSGNVVFTAGARLAARVPGALTGRLERELGLSVPVILRSADELAAVRAENPFLARGVAEDALHVMFLADAPTKAALAGLAPDRSPPDEFVVAGREIFLSCPNGLARTKLSNAYFDAKLATTSTCRNWRTVGELLRLATAS